jgi:hypothetical protein
VGLEERRIETELGFQLRAVGLGRRFLFDGDAKAVHSSVLCNIQHLDHPVKNNALVCSHDDRSIFTRSHERLKLVFQIPKGFCFVVEKDLVSTVDRDHDRLFLIYRSFDIGLRKLHHDPRLTGRIERVNEAKGGKEEDEDVHDNISQCN